MLQAVHETKGFLPPVGMAFGGRSPIHGLWHLSVPQEVYQDKPWNGSALGFVNSTGEQFWIYPSSLKLSLAIGEMLEEGLNQETETEYNIASGEYNVQDDTEREHFGQWSFVYYPYCKLFRKISQRQKSF